MDNFHFALHSYISLPLNRGCHGICALNVSFGSILNIFIVIFNLFLPSIFCLQNTSSNYVHLKIYGQDHTKVGIQIRKDVPFQYLIDAYCKKTVSMNYKYIILLNIRNVFNFNN